MTRFDGRKSIAGLFDFFLGRSTFFGIVFTIIGIILAFLGKLTMEYVALVGAIQALVFCHSWKEDVNEQRLAAEETKKNLEQ